MPLVVPFQVPARNVPASTLTTTHTSSNAQASRATAAQTRSAQLQPPPPPPPRTTFLALALPKNPTSTLHISITALTSVPRRQQQPSSVLPPSSSTPSSQKRSLTLMIHMTTTATITAPPQSTTIVPDGSSTANDPSLTADLTHDPSATTTTTSSHSPSNMTALGSFVYALPPLRSSTGYQTPPLCTPLVAVPSSIDFATRMAKAVCCKTCAAVYLSWSGRFGMLGGLAGEAAGVGVGAAAAEQIGGGGGGSMLDVDEEMDAMRIAVDAIVRSVPS